MRGCTCGTYAIYNPWIGLLKFRVFSAKIDIIIRFDDFFLIFLGPKIGVERAKISPPERDLEPLVLTVGSDCSCFAGKLVQTSNWCDLEPFKSHFHRARRGQIVFKNDFFVDFWRNGPAGAKLFSKNDFFVDFWRNEPAGAKLF